MRLHLSNVFWFSSIKLAFKIPVFCKTSDMGECISYTVYCVSSMYIFRWYKNVDLMTFLLPLWHWMAYFEIILCISVLDYLEKTNTPDWVTTNHLLCWYQGSNLCCTGKRLDCYALQPEFLVYPAILQLIFIVTIQYHTFRKTVSMSAVNVCCLWYCCGHSPTLFNLQS